MLVCSETAVLQQAEGLWRDGGPADVATGMGANPVAVRRSCESRTAAGLRRRWLSQASASIRTGGGTTTGSTASNTSSLCILGSPSLVLLPGDMEIKDPGHESSFIPTWNQRPAVHASRPRLRCVPRPLWIPGRAAGGIPGDAKSPPGTSSGGNGRSVPRIYHSGRYLMLLRVISRLIVSGLHTSEDDPSSNVSFLDIAI